MKVGLAKKQRERDLCAASICLSGPVAPTEGEAEVASAPPLTATPLADDRGNPSCAIPAPFGRPRVWAKSMEGRTMRLEKERKAG
jgi:hypothetical protein